MEENPQSISNEKRNAFIIGSINNQQSHPLLKTIKWNSSTLSTISIIIIASFPSSTRRGTSTASLLMQFGENKNVTNWWPIRSVNPDGHQLLIELFERFQSFYVTSSIPWYRFDHFSALCLPKWLMRDFRSTMQPVVTIEQRPINNNKTIPLVYINRRLSSAKSTFFSSTHKQHSALEWERDEFRTWIRACVSWLNVHDARSEIRGKTTKYDYFMIILYIQDFLHSFLASFCFFLLLRFIRKNQIV